MGHELQERYSKLVLAKVRKELKLKDGVVFNNDYEGDPAAGVVKIPVRDEEVVVSDYDRLNGINITSGSTTYDPFPIKKDVAVNEIIDDYEATAVPDNIVADRLDSAGYALAAKLDNDAATVLIAGSTPMNVGALTVDTVYSTIVDIRTAMSKANIPDDGRRYLLITPEVYAYVLKCPEFVKASSLGADVIQNGIVGRIAGFNVIEWNDSTANLAMIAGHPRFATRINAWKKAIHIQDLNGDGKHIGACAVQGRQVYDHKVLRSVAIRAVYTPGSLGITASQAGTSGNTVLNVTGGTGSALAYKVNPAERAVFNMTSTAYAGTSLTSGSTKITANAADIIEVVDLASSKVKAVGYITVTAASIKA